MITLVNTAFGQITTTERKYPKIALQQDLMFIKKQIFDVHAYPWSELNRNEYERLFDSIDHKISDSLLIIDYYKLVKPIISFLSDEHSEITLPKDNSLLNEQSWFLPFALKKAGNFLVIDTLLVKNEFIHKGDTLKSIDNKRINDIVNNLINYSTGYPDQRKSKSLQYFGYLYPIGYEHKSEYLVELNNHLFNIKSIKDRVWKNYLKQLNKGINDCVNIIKYKKYGSIGYIKSCGFYVKNDSDLLVIGNKIKEVFKQINQDKVDKIIIDVSQNSGGNSQVGDMLISGFCNKPYQSYQCYWKRSDEYLHLLKSWGITNALYEKIKVGETVHFNSDEVKPNDFPNRFGGKVYILIGNGTFSSAMQFATLVKDNAMATIIGQTPLNGHPSHFGELYNCTTPIAKLEIRFGVKQWIRPSGVMENNRLTPDIIIEEPQPFDIEKVINHLPK